MLISGYGNLSFSKYKIAYISFGDFCRQLGSQEQVEWAMEYRQSELEHYFRHDIWTLEDIYYGRIEDITAV